MKAVDADGCGAFLTGTLGFAVVAVVLWVQYGWLAAQGLVWMLWVCLTGVGLGLLGLGIALRRRGRRSGDHSNKP